MTSPKLHFFFQLMSIDYYEICYKVLKKERLVKKKFINANQNLELFEKLDFNFFIMICCFLY